MKQNDIYTEALSTLRLILQRYYPEWDNWVHWLTQDMEDWTERRQTAHHLGAYGGMGSFNDLPMRNENHSYVFWFLKSVCWSFADLYGRQTDSSTEALMEECLTRAEEAPYHPRKDWNRFLARHLRQGDLQQNLFRLWDGSLREQAARE